MAQFEFVTTLASFVVAFGVSRLLAGWAHQYAQRAQTPVYPLQAATSVLLLIGLLQSTWAFWVYRDIQWTFSTFLAMLITQLALVGAATLIHPPNDHRTTIREYHLDVRRAVFGLSAVWVVLGGVPDFNLIGSLPDYTSFEVVSAFRAPSLCIFAVMAWSDRPAYHWAGLTVLAMLQLGFIAFVSNDFGA